MIKIPIIGPTTDNEVTNKPTQRSRFLSLKYFPSGIHANIPKIKAETEPTHPIVEAKTPDMIAHVLSRKMSISLRSTTYSKFQLIFDTCTSALHKYSIWQT